MTKCIVAAAVMQLLEEIGKRMTRLLHFTTSAVHSVLQYSLIALNMLGRSAAIDQRPLSVISSREIIYKIN